LHLLQSSVQRASGQAPKQVSKDPSNNLPFWFTYWRVLKIKGPPVPVFWKIARFKEAPFVVYSINHKNPQWCFLQCFDNHGYILKNRQLSGSISANYPNTEQSLSPDIWPEVPQCVFNGKISPKTEI
jgi:hypothetical protein